MFSVTIASSAGQLNHENVTLSGELRVFNGCDSFVTFGVAGKVAFVSVRGRVSVINSGLRLMTACCTFGDASSSSSEQALNRLPEVESPSGEQ